MPSGADQVILRAEIHSRFDNHDDKVINEINIQGCSCHVV